MTAATVAVKFSSSRFVIFYRQVDMSSQARWTISRRCLLSRLASPHAAKKNTKRSSSGTNTDSKSACFFYTRLISLLSSLAVSLIVFSTPCNVARASDETAPSMTSAPLSVDQVVTNLVRGNDEQSRRLLRSQATRVYHLAYRGTAGVFEAEMTVEASYDSPSTKDFKVVSESGPKIILDRVLKKLLESEKEATQPEVRARTQLNYDNYNFKLVGFERSANQYVLQVTPKAKSKYLYRGQIWVDGNDFAVSRIEAEPVQNPSFWTKRNRIRQEYAREQNIKHLATDTQRIRKQYTLRRPCHLDYRIQKLPSDTNQVMIGGHACCGYRKVRPI